MKPQRLTQLCETLSAAGLDARREGEDCLIQAVNTLEDAVDGEISFLANEKYASAIETTGASAVILSEGVDLPDGVSAIRCADPYAAVTVAIIAIHGYRRHPKWGVSDRATIDESAKIGGNAHIAHGVTISADVVLGDNCTLYPGCYIGDGTTLGDGCTLFPNVVVYDHCRLGHRVTVHAGSVIGEDGLGYAPVNGKWTKIPQVGHAVIGDDVEIGANCAIDRATLGRTEIGSGTKFGNVVVIGHGTKVGPDCLFVGVVGVAGSVKVGRHVTVAGHVGIAGHLSVGDNATIAAKSGVSGDVEAGSTILGYPAIPIKDFRRASAVYKKLPALSKRVRDLERELDELRETLGNSNPA